MNTRITPRAARTALVFFMAGGLVALGCSLVVDFDESKIPSTDSAVGDDTTDTAETTPPPDTTDTNPPDDTNLPDIVIDSGTDSGADTGDGEVATDGDAADVTDATDAADTADTAADTTDATVADTTDAADVSDAADTTDSADTTDAADASDTADGDGATGTPFTATLSGTQEVPVITTTGSGTATMTLDPGETTLSYTITYTLPSGHNPTMGHFHTAPGGSSGALTQAFCTDATTCASPITGTWTGLTSGQVADLKAGKIYLNVHSDFATGGELRGQALRPGEILYTAVMDGASEVPAVTTTSTGGAGFILSADKTKLTYSATVTGFTWSGLEIHLGASGATGGTVYTLSSTALATIDGTQAVSSTDITNLDGNLWYLNALSTANPTGEVRGQMRKMP